MILELLAIQIIATLVIDYTGAVDDMLTPLVRWITGSRVGTIGKPFSCSTCTCFWASLIYLLITGQFGWWSLVLTLVFACTTDLTLALFLLLKDAFGTLVETISKIFNL